MRPGFDPPIVLPPDDEIAAAEVKLLGLIQAVGLIRYGPAERARLGVTSTLWQIRKSFEALAFLRADTKFRPLFVAVDAECWNRLVSLRIGLVPARRLAASLRQALGQAILLLDGEIGEACDEIAGGEVIKPR